MKRLSLLLACLLAAACARLPPTVPGDVVRVPSPNFDERRPNYVILHQTSNGDAGRALATLTNPERKVSAHYLIGRDGTVYQLVDERARAWHAGVSYWGGNADLNSASIGIELDNDGEEPFAELQIERLLQVLRDLKGRYGIPRANFLGHGDVAPRRKVDPSALFPWARLAAEGFGLWCARAEAADAGIGEATVGLRLLGYDTADPSAALRAFRRHFLGIDSDAEPNAEDFAMLGCLARDKAVAAQP